MAYLTVMREPFVIDVAQLPHPADMDAAARGQSDFLDRMQLDQDSEPLLIDAARTFSETAPGRKLLDAIFANSPFLTQCLLREPAWLGRVVC